MIYVIGGASSRRPVAPPRRAAAPGSAIRDGAQTVQVPDKDALPPTPDGPLRFPSGQSAAYRVQTGSGHLGEVLSRYRKTDSRGHVCPPLRPEGSGHGQTVFDILGGQLRRRVCSCSYRRPSTERALPARTGFARICPRMTDPFQRAARTASTAVAVSRYCGEFASTGKPASSTAPTWRIRTCWPFSVHCVRRTVPPNTAKSFVAGAPCSNRIAPAAKSDRRTRHIRRRSLRPPGDEYRYVGPSLVSP